MLDPGIGTVPRPAARERLLALLCLALTLAAPAMAQTGEEMEAQAPAACAPGATAPAPTTIAGLGGDPTLFRREPPGYDLESVGRLRDLIVASYDDLPGILARARDRGRQVGAMNSLMLMSLMLAVIATIAGYRRVPGHTETALAPLAERLPAGGRAWLSAGGAVFAATAPPLVLWLLHHALTRLTGFTGPGYIIVGIFLLAWTTYALVASTIHELVLRPLIPMPVEHGRYLYRVTCWLALYGLVLYALLDAAAVLGVPGDVIALVAALLDLSLFVMFFASLRRKSAVMALFPKLPNRIYQRFVRAFGAAYRIIYVLTAATFLLWMAGYEHLARAVWLRSWAVAALFLAIVFLLHLLHQGSRRAIVDTQQPTRESERFCLSVVRLLDLIGVAFFILAALELTRLRLPLLSALATPVYSFVDRPLSLLMGAEACLVVVAFVIAARLLRDYLNFQIYPALAVDTGIANAIDVFITYAMVIVGALFALELVGVGVGVLTVFAGALGIGLGFGLQPIANNLTSGLTLVFGRALRRGDWVAHGDTVGMVEEIGMRATSLRSSDSVEYLVPNSEFVSGTIVNWTHSSPLVREHVPVSVAYGSDPEEVREILLRVAHESPDVEPEPAAEVWFTGFGDNGLDFELLVWMNVKAVTKQPLRSSLYFAIFRAFRDAGIEIPFPQRDLHVRSVSRESARTLAELAHDDAPVRPAAFKRGA